MTFFLAPGESGIFIAGDHSTLWPLDVSADTLGLAQPVGGLNDNKGFSQCIFLEI